MYKYSFVFKVPTIFVYHVTNVAELFLPDEVMENDY